MPTYWSRKSGHSKRELTAGNIARIHSAIRGIKAIGDTGIPAAKECFFIQRPSPKIKVQEGGRHKTKLTPITSTTKVCTKQTTADSKDTELHALFNNQPRFRAGQIVSALSEWRAITSDPTILEFVTGVKIEFTPGLRPEQNNVRSSVFNRMQHVIVANEMETLLSKGVVKHSSHEPGEFISTIFLRPKPDGAFRMIPNLRAFNEFVQYHHFKMDTLEIAAKMMKPGCSMASIDLKDAYYKNT